MALSHYGMRLNGARALCAALAVNRRVTTLRLGHNDIGDAGLVRLAGALRTNDSITDIDLTGAPSGFVPRGFPRGVSGRGG